jgi:hypothetical protein
MPWMTDLFYNAALNASWSPFPHRSLHQITLPGTHDSGCFRDQTIANVWSVTQTQTIFQQLAGGIRYFDIRPCFDGNEFWTYHGPLYYGDRLTGADGILNQINLYLNSLAQADRELVVINVSHFYNFTPDLHQQLVLAIQSALQNHLLDYSQASISLFDAPYWQLLSDSVNGVVPWAQNQTPIRSRVVVLYDGALDTPVESFVQENPFFPPQAAGLGTNGFFVLSPKYNSQGDNYNPIYLFDQYSNSADVKDGYISTGMRSDQLVKLRNRAGYPYSAQGHSPGNWPANAVGGVPGILHLLSWTLTPQFKSLNPFSYDPLTAARDYANPLLLDLFCNPNRGWADSYYNLALDPKINIIYVDNYASEWHSNVLSDFNSYAMPVAIAARMNIGPVGPAITW